MVWLLCKFAGAHNCGGNLATSISCQLSAFGIQQPIFDGIAFLFVAFAIVMAQLHLSTPVVYCRVARSVWLLCIISIVMAILATKNFCVQLSAVCTQLPSLDGSRREWRYDRHLVAFAELPGRSGCSVFCF